jgi:hypothetical protein
MINKARFWRNVFVVVLALAAPARAQAGPYLGDWGWCWHPARDCPRGQYSWLHYWAPELYQIRACVCPSNLDQYPPGPYPPVLPSFEYTGYRCQVGPAAPTSPYANPTAYYGRPLVRQ